LILIFIIYIKILITFFIIEITEKINAFNNFDYSLVVYPYIEKYLVKLHLE